MAFSLRPSGEMRAISLFPSMHDKAVHFFRMGNAQYVVNPSGLWSVGSVTMLEQGRVLLVTKPSPDSGTHPRESVWSTAGLWNKAWSIRRFANRRIRCCMSSFEQIDVLLMKVSMIR